MTTGPSDNKLEPLPPEGGVVGRLRDAYENGQFGPIRVIETLDLFREAASEIERLTRENERLDNVEAERDDWETSCHQSTAAADAAEGALTAALQRAEAAEAERDAAVKALGEERKTVARLRRIMSTPTTEA